jgi:hypothetical protein
MTDKQQPAENRERGQRRKERKRSVHGGGSVEMIATHGTSGTEFGLWLAQTYNPRIRILMNYYVRDQSTSTEECKAHIAR